MKKISVADIVKFVRKSPVGRATFIANLKKPKIKIDGDEGGNYWIISCSTISQVFKSEKLISLDDKIENVGEKKKNATAKISKHMYQRNIDILHNAKEFDYRQLKPYLAVNFIKNTKVVLELQGVPIQIIPSHVFNFEEGDAQKIGAIWFVAKKKGYRKEELALFLNSLYEYLKKTYGEKYEISFNYCIAFDIVSADKLTYKQMVDLGHKSYINEVLDTLKKAIG